MIDWLGARQQLSTKTITFGEDVYFKYPQV